MNTLAEILSNSYNDQGIQNLDVVYDSYFFNLKIKDSTNNNNILLIEKISFDYDDAKIVRSKNPILISFGNSGIDTPFYSNGNCFIKPILDKINKKVYLIGLRSMSNGNTIPVVYLYDLNAHEYKNIFPTSEDLTNFGGFVNYSFKTDNLPVCNIINDRLYLVFQTTDGTFNYINSLEFRLKSETCTLIDYDMTKYDDQFNIQFLDVNNEFMTYKYGNYHGVLERTTFE